MEATHHSVKMQLPSPVLTSIFHTILHLDREAGQPGDSLADSRGRLPANFPLFPMTLGSLLSGAVNREAP